MPKFRDLGLSAFSLLLVSTGKSSAQAPVPAFDAGGASSVPPGVTMLSGDAIPDDRAVYLLMTLVNQREDHRPGTARKVLMQNGAMSDLAADLVIEVARKTGGEISEKNRRHRDQVCGNTQRHSVSGRALGQAMAASEADLEATRLSAYAQLSAALNADDYTNLVEYARESASGFTILTFDWKAISATGEFDPGAVLARSCSASQQ